VKAPIKWLAIAVSLAVAWVSAPAISSAAPSSSTGAGQASSSSSASTQASHKKSRKHHSKQTPTQKAPTADRISEIQSALARSGYYQGDPNGKWDSSTVASMQKFQSANGIEPTGKLDAATLQKLGLGSDIAGVSAPRPACCSMAQPSSPPSGDKPAMMCCSASPSSQPQQSVPTGPAGGTSNSTASVSDPKSPQH